MLRTMLATVFAAALCAGAARADVLMGKITAVDAEKNTVTLTTTDKKEMTLEMDKEGRIFRTVGTGKKAKTEDVPGGLKGLEIGSSVSVFTEKKKDKDYVTQIKIEGATKKPK